MAPKLSASEVRKMYNYRPYQVLHEKWGFKQAEVMSYPFGDSEVVLMFVREYDDPTTARYVNITADRTDLAEEPAGA